MVSFVRIGAAGLTKGESFPSETIVRGEAETLIREKIGKRCQEVQPAGAHHPKTRFLID